MMRIMSIVMWVLVVVGLAACSQEAGTTTAPTGDLTQVGPVEGAYDDAWLVDRLRGAGATVDPGDEVAQPFFSVTGRLVKVNGADVQVFAFDSEDAAQEEAALVAPNGGSVGTSMMSWMATPHFYRLANLLVLYVGDDGTVTDLLEAALGPQFAGGGPAAGEPPSPAVSSRIAFTGREASATNIGPGDIYVMNADGSGRTQLTTDPANDQSPAWSPDGTRIAFVSDRDGNAEIYVMAADGSQQTRLTQDAGEDTVPAWSPDGSRLVFRSDRDGNYEIYTLEVDGGAVARLTDDPALDTTPAWSPDGKQIAFVSDRDGNPEIYLLMADGSGLQQLTRDTSADSFDPAWSPDGKQIAFVKGSQLYVMQADGSAPTQVTAVETLVGRPTWSPDGLWIGFDAGFAGGAVWGIYAVTLDGVTAVTLTPSGRPGYDHQPSWSGSVGQVAAPGSGG